MFNGMELHDTKVWLSSSVIKYTQGMGIHDETTVYENGIHSGTSNYIRVGTSNRDSSFTVLEFIEDTSFTGEHVDTARIVGQVEINPRDLPGLIGLLQSRLDDISKQ